MRLIIISLLLASIAFGQPYQPQAVANAVTQTTAASGQTAENQNPPYDFYWAQASDTPEFGTFGRPMNLVFGAAVGSDVLSIAFDDFSEAKIENNTNTNIWATTRRGSLQFQFMYPSFVSGRSLMFLDGKEGNGSGPLNTEEGIQIRTIIPVATPALFMRYVGNNGAATVNTTNLTIAGAAIDTWFTVKAQWNSSAARTLQLQVGNEPGLYSATALTATRAQAWHQVLLGNDTDVGFEHDQRLHYIFPTWTYDMASNVWQDFEFATVDQASLEANDHTSSQTWSLAGTTTRFTTDVAGAYTMPCRINFQTPTASTRGLRNDLNATAAGSIGIPFTNSTSAQVFGMWLYTANLANGTSARIAFATENSPGNTIVALEQSDSAGQEQLYIRNHAGTSSSVINVSAGTWYWCSVLAIRNNTSRLQIFDTSGVQVGSEVTVTGSNNSIGNIRIGSLNTTTSQTAGTYHYIQGFCYDSQALVFPFKPWE